MQFFGRERELRRLHHLVAGDRPAFAVVWGRRRIGKTRLLLEWVKRDHGLYWVADETGPAAQRSYFAQALAARLPGFADVQYRDWRSLLIRLARDAKHARWRGPIVIDELPYLLAGAPELPSVLQGFVDHEAKDANLVFAVAGSSQRMMQGLALAPNAPLYGRARELIHLQPLPIAHLGEALALSEPARIVEAFALWGGVPRYWELAADFKRTDEAVEALILDPMGPLHEEPMRLLLEEVPSAAALRPLLDAAGAGAHRLSEIAGRLGQPATSLSRPLTRLQELGLLRREIPFGDSERTSKRALYKIGDPFTRAWFTLVAPRRGQLAQATPAQRKRVFESSIHALRSAAWEDLCRDTVAGLGHVLEGVDWSPAGRYWGAGEPEWDVVASAGNRMLLGEAKWAERGDATRVEQIHASLKAKGVPRIRSGRPEEITHAVFITSAPRHEKRVRGVTVVTAEDIVSASAG